MADGKLDLPLKKEKLTNQVSYRLINSKFPPITLFDDVINIEDFETAYAIQRLTNPRSLNELGDLTLLRPEEIPFGINGVNYATAPFTHITPDGSRFSNGDFGILYLADSIDTAIQETRYHQEKYFQNVQELHYDTIDMRCLKAIFSANILDCSTIENIHNKVDYTASRQFGLKLKKQKIQGLKYNSVRNNNAFCWGLFSPIFVSSIIQTQHYEFIFDGQSISKIRKLANNC